ncbi:Eukaryotic translation initiation factor 4B [Eumeta japonica]|uniref:Eukaryotic translation initiation factor 4B n=1 Tax=Eumeta variegata TaxID=151549 RepID=A0A4C1SWM5_EUMVA|nr:Eukaryotic translation initiation factor 4B [Eumeta japonica]
MVILAGFVDSATLNSESRDDLMQALGIRDPAIKGRRIRIDVSNENERNSRQRGPRRGNESSGSGVDSNWRRDNNTKRDQYNFAFERNFKDQMHTSDDNNSPGSWRAKTQNPSIIHPPLEQVYINNRDDIHTSANTEVERPKLNLKPRTLPLPELDTPSQISLESKNNDLDSVKHTGVSAEKVFGSAKPVDTSARDFEIEERLEKEMRKTASDLKEMNLKKDDKIKSHGQNWRQQNEHMEAWKNKEGKKFKNR